MRLDPMSRVRRPDWRAVCAYQCLPCPTVAATLFAVMASTYLHTFHPLTLPGYLLRNTLFTMTGQTSPAYHLLQLLHLPQTCLKRAMMPIQAEARPARLHPASPRPRVPIHPRCLRSPSADIARRVSMMWRFSCKSQNSSALAPKCAKIKQSAVSITTEPTSRTSIRPRTRGISIAEHVPNTSDSSQGRTSAGTWLGREPTQHRRSCVGVGGVSIAKTNSESISRRGLAPATHP